MRNAIITRYCLFVCFLVITFSTNGQTTRWLECKYFNQATDIQYLYNPYSRMEASSGKTRLLISDDAFGITIYNSNGPSYFYKSRPVGYQLNNGINLPLYEGINDERQYYQIGLVSPYGNQSKLYESGIIIATNTKANFYGTVLLYEVDQKSQQVDNRLSISIDSIIVLNKTIETDRYIHAKQLLITSGKTLKIDQEHFELQIIKGNERSRHYLIKDNGTELMVRQDGGNFTFSQTLVDGGLIRYYASRK
jgi:hypothetical protein